ncbi:MAG: site-2 protease family protein, partial [Clostridia bacterium]|nr:site-2 protease family protein [Clostridia bacterium]
MAFLATMGKILAALVIFGLIVTIHEFGHFIVAKLNRVKVNEFAIGMGPKLLQFGRGETKYTLRLLPIGGFCAMEGEDPDTEMPESLGGSGYEKDEEQAAEAKADGRAFYQKKVWQRMLIVVAGAVMNLVLGYVLLVVNYAFCQTPDANGQVLFSTTTIHSLAEDAPAYQTGLRPGDTILSINGRRVLTADFDMVSALQSDEDGVFDMVVRRGEEKVELNDVTFNLVTDENGNRFLQYDFIIVGEERTFGNTLTFALKNEYSVGVMIFRTLGDMVTGKYGLNDLSGPVGTVDIIGDAVENVVVETDKMEGIRTLLMLIILITVNVGVFNLLPLPALDGGRLVFLLVE